MYFHHAGSGAKATLLALPDPHPLPLSTRERGGGRRRGIKKYGCGSHKGEDSRAATVEM